MTKGWSVEVLFAWVYERCGNVIHVYLLACLIEVAARMTGVDKNDLFMEKNVLNRYFIVIYNRETTSITSDLPFCTPNPLVRRSA